MTQPEIVWIKFMTIVLIVATVLSMIFVIIFNFLFQVP